MTRLEMKLIKAAARQSEKGYYMINNPTTGKAIGSCNKAGEFMAYEPYSKPAFICNQLVFAIMNGTLTHDSRAARFGMLKSIRQMRASIRSSSDR